MTCEHGRTGRMLRNCLQYRYWLYLIAELRRWRHPIILQFFFPDADMCIYVFFSSFFFFNFVFLLFRDLRQDVVMVIFDKKNLSTNCCTAVCTAKTSLPPALFYSVLCVLLHVASSISDCLYFYYWY